MVSKIASSEYLNFEGEKFSKTNNHGVFGNDAMELEFPPDIWRFYLISQRPENKDTDFTWNDFYSKLNGQLVNNVGNFINRVLSLIHKNFGKVPERKLVEEEHIDNFIKQELQNHRI